MDHDLIFARYYNLALRYLSYRPRSEKEIIEYLLEKSKRNSQLDSKMIDSIVQKLKEYKFIDDREFLKFWFDQRTKYKKKPIKVVKFELIQKGVSKNLIEDYISQIENNEFDLENAKSLAKKKMDFYRNLESNKRKEKVMNYLLRKGFSYDIVKKISVEF